MLYSIRNKIIVVVLGMILLIQVISVILQSYQVRKMFTEEIILRTQNLAQYVFFDLEKRVQEYRDSMYGDTDEKQIEEMFKVFVQLIQSEMFGTILESKEDLHRIQYIDKNGELIAISRKTEEGVQHQFKSNNKGAKADDIAIKLMKKGLLAFESEQNLIYIYVPLKIKEVSYGGLVLTYSDEHMKKGINQIYLTGTILGVVFVIFSFFGIITFVKSVVGQPIQQMIDLMSKLADGDLEQRYRSNRRDEISKMGNSVNKLAEALQSIFSSIEEVMGAVEKGDLSRKITIDLKGDLHSVKLRINQSILLLSETILSVRDTSQSVEHSAKELTNSAEALSSSSSKQASTIEEVSSSVAEIESHSKQNSEHSTKAKELTNSTLELVNKGNDQMEEMQASMDEINETSQNVTKIIKVIDEIAFQTNLLALNAAVEAARAGKYGKGFSVVAEEVRNLAARSAEAARNTSDLIESSMQQVQNGVQKTEQTSSILKEIVKEVEKSNELITLIAGASRKQTEGISQIYSGMSLTNESVQQNSAIAEETAASSDVLLNQSSSLQQEIARFKLSAMDIRDQVDHEPELTYPQITL